MALELPSAVVAAAHAWALEAASDLRVLPRESLHVTLVFLGEQSDSVLNSVSEGVVQAARPVRALSLGRPAALGRGSALALDVQDGRGECAALQSSLSSLMSSAVGHQPDARKFRPHLTVARGDGVRTRGLPKPPSTGDFAGEAVTLFRSHLGRRGARYEALVSASLHVPGS